MIECATEIALGRILVATDLSPRSQVALDWAKSIAKSCGSELFVTHIISPAETAFVPPEYWGSSQAMIEMAAERGLRDIDGGLRDVAHQVSLRHGGVSETMVAEMEESRIDLLVLATHARQGLARFAAGSVAEEAIRRATCPVVTIGPRVNPVPPASAQAALHNILLATDFGPHSLRALNYAVLLAEQFNGRLIVLHVIAGPRVSSAEMRIAVAVNMDRLRTQISRTSADRGNEYLVEFGDPVEQILRVARERNASVIVMGAKQATGHLRAATHLSASTVHDVIGSAPCPVLTLSS